MYLPPLKLLCRHHHHHHILRSTLLVLSSHCVSFTRTSNMSSSHLWQKVQISQPSLKDRDLKIHLSIVVLDTHKHKDITDVPTVVAIGGLPGQIDEFDTLCTRLPPKGIRLVVPYFPGFGPSTLEKWQVRHIDFSTEGRAQLLYSVLDELDINRVDMLLCFSGGCWLGYKMAASNHMVKSAGFLSFVGARPHRPVRPVSLMQIGAWLFLFEWLQTPLMAFVAFVYKIFGFVGITPGMHLVVTQQIVSKPGFDKMPGYGAKIARRKLPIFMACFKNDKVVEFPIMKEMALNHIGIPEDCVIEYSKDKVPNRSPLNVFAGDWLARLLVFERGGHWVHKTHTDQIVDQIVSVINHTQKQTNRLVKSPSEPPAIID